MSYLSDITLRRGLAFLVMALAILIGGTWAIVKITTGHLVDEYVKGTATDWAQFLAANVDDLGQIAAGEQPSAASMAFFKATQKSNQVFRYVIFNRHGYSQLLVDRDRIASVDLSRFSRAPARLDPQDLDRLNATLLHGTDFAAVRDRLPTGATEAFWLAIRGNIGRVAEAADWWPVVSGEIETVHEDPAVIAAAAEALPPEPWDATTWKALTQAISAKTGAKGKALFHPLRLALTGREDGPELKSLLPLLGRKSCQDRLT